MPPRWEDWPDEEATWDAWSGPKVDLVLPFEWGDGVELAHEDSCHITWAIQPVLEYESVWEPSLVIWTPNDDFEIYQKIPLGRATVTGTVTELALLAEVKATLVALQVSNVAMEQVARFVGAVESARYDIQQFAQYGLPAQIVQAARGE